MGFRQNAYAKVWEVDRKSDTMTKLRISTSRKNKKTEEYEVMNVRMLMLVTTTNTEDMIAAKQEKHLIVLF